MEKFLRTTVHLFLLLSFLTVAVTGLLKVAEYRSHAVGEIHEIAGLTLIGLGLIHVYIFRRMFLLLFRKSTKTS